VLHAPYVCIMSTMTYTILFSVGNIITVITRRNMKIMEKSSSTGVPQILVRNCTFARYGRKETVSYLCN
jgi:hypothetical protein